MAEVFARRSRILRGVRRYLDERGYLEVETPVLQPLFGGAAGRPFVTRHNALDMDLYLRISNELYLKRLIVGGFERVYEIGHDFRNEGMDRSHNPEFTMLELYQAYADYGDMMGLAETLVTDLVRMVSGGLTLTRDGVTLDFTPPFARVGFVDGIRQGSGLDVLEAPEATMRARLVQAGLPAVGHIPLHQQALAWAMKRNVELVQLADNYMPLKWVSVKGGAQ